MELNGVFTRKGYDGSSIAVATEGTYFFHVCKTNPKAIELTSNQKEFLQKDFKYGTPFEFGRGES